MPTFGKRSTTNLNEAHPKLQRVFNEVIKHFDCSVIQGYRLKEEQDKANRTALEFLNLWLEANKLNPVTLNEGLAFGRQVNIY